MREPIRAIGMARTMINVALHLPRNMNTTNITTSKVIRMVFRRELMVLMMLSEESMTVEIWMSGGRLG